MDISPTDIAVPNGFLRFSDAVDRLVRGLWGGLRRPLPVRRMKRKYKEGSIGFGPWKEQAGRVLTAAATDGKLRIYVFAPRSGQSGNSTSGGPIAMPRDVVGRLITRRGSIPDQAIRPVLRTAGGDKDFLELLYTGTLLVREKEFTVWYRSERRKGRWPSQAAKPKKVGKPSTLTPNLKVAIIAALGEGKTGIAALQRRLMEAGQLHVPSPDTLARFVDQLYRETGDPALLRKRKRRRLN